MTGAKCVVQVTPPILRYPGPNDTISGVLNRAARNLDNGYDVGGSGVRQIVAQLLREVGDQIGEVNMVNPLSCTCEHYIVDHSDPEPHHPENVDREDDHECPVHGTSAVIERVRLLVAEWDGVGQEHPAWRLLEPLRAVLDGADPV